MDASPRGRPWAEPRDEQRDRIILAARRAFTEEGYDAATLSGIAREANVPRPAVYEVIGSKEDLLGAVADVVADELIARADERFSRPDEVDRPLGEIVRDDVRWFIELIAGEPSYTASAAPGPPPRLAERQPGRAGPSPHRGPPDGAPHLPRAGVRRRAPGRGPGPGGHDAGADRDRRRPGGGARLAGRRGGRSGERVRCSAATCAPRSTARPRPSRSAPPTAAADPDRRRRRRHAAMNERMAA